MKTQKKLAYLKHATALYAFLLITWGFYRLLFQFPDAIEAVFVKPMVWLVPVYLLLRKEKLGWRSVGFTTKRLFSVIYFALTLGVIFALEGMVINYLKHGGLNFGANLGENAFLIALVLSFVTAVSEEVSFRGYLFNRVWKVLENEWMANFVTSFGWALIHLPIALFDWKLDVGALLVYLGLTLTYSIGASFVFARTKNIFSAIFLHVLWQWPIILYR